MQLLGVCLSSPKMGIIIAPFLKGRGEERNGLRTASGHALLAEYWISWLLCLISHKLQSAGVLFMTIIAGPVFR